jgi:HK97 family phage major capsid protein
MLTNEQIEKRLKETADLVENAVEDIKKNLATKQEVVGLINERVGEDSEIIKNSHADIDRLNSGIVEVKAEIDRLNNQLRNLNHQKLSSQFQQSAKGYSGYFSSPQEAKAFALLVMSATMGNHDRFKSRVEQVNKSLEGMGIEPYLVNGSGHKVMVGSGQVAGSLVTVEQIPSIIMLIETYGKYRANAQSMPMGAGQTTQPKIDGLLTGYVPGEGGTITEDEPEIPVITLTPRTINFLTAYSMELEDDALVPLGEMLAGLFARSMAYTEDLIGFLGDSTSTYFGMTGITGALRAVDATISNIKSLVVAAGNAYSEITLANFESLVGTLPEFADDGDAKWYIHRYFFWTVMVKLALAAGSGTATEIITGEATRKKTYMGYPAEFAQVMPKAEADSQICALLANLRQGAMLGTRGGIEFAQSSERYFEKGVIAVRGRDRVAINAHGVGNTTNAGPICALITAAS